MKSIPLALFLFAVAFLPRIAVGQSTFPAYTGASVYVQGTEDVFDPVRAAIKSAEAKSPRRYYVVVLGSTGEWNQSPQQLVESLFEQWTKDAAASGKPLERANGTLILVAIEQRDIVVRTGQNLQGQYGLDQNALEKDLVPKAFMPKARDGDLPGALVSLIGAMETRIAAQDAATAARKQMYSRNLPIAIGGGVVLTLVAGAGIFLWRAQRRSSRFGKAFAAFNAKLVELMDRSDTIKQQHQLLPYSDKDFTEPMSGATLALYTGIEDRLANLRATWLNLMEVRNQIEKLSATAGFFDSAQRTAAEKLLADKAKLPEVEALYEQCQRDLETLGAAHETAVAAWDAATKSNDELPAKIAAIEAAGLSSRPYEEQRTAIAQRLESLRAQLTSDPIGTTSLVQEVQEHRNQVAAVIAQLLELDASWRKTGARREEIVGQVTAERAAGLNLDEEHANPDAPLEAAEKSLAVSRESLLDNRLDDTASATTEAQLALDAAVQLVANVRAAREYCREQLPAVENALAQTRVQQPPAEEHLRALERDFAAESWNNVAPNAVRAAELLGAATQAWRGATEMAADGRQQYVASAARLKQAADANASAQTMLTAIGDRLRELNALREQCAQQRGELLDAVRQLQTYLGQHADTVDQEARSHLAEASRIEEQVVAGLDSSRPNWPVVKQRLDQLAAAIQSAREAAEADVRHRAALEATLQESETLSARVANTLRSHTADRPRANQAYRRAAAALAELRERRSNWKGLLAAATEAKQDLVNAEQWATQDIQLAAQAMQAITAAERAVGSARSFVSLGISAESGVAASTLAESQRQFAAQQYEQTIASAGSAEQQARQAVQAAEQAAQMRRMQQEAERRRRDAERHGSGPVVIPSLPTFTFGGGASSPAPRPSQAATGNWSIGGGGSAHGNWSGGASHNKW
jgi:uncharacterized membrane protein YgcG